MRARARCCADFVLTLYGFDEAAHAALTARWQAWFDAAFDTVTVQT